MTNTMEPARYMSWFCSAVMSRGPTVGSESTIESTVCPEIRPGSIQPTVAMKGISAMRTGYLIKRRMLLTPLARAVFT